MFWREIDTHGDIDAIARIVYLISVLTLECMCAVGLAELSSLLRSISVQSKSHDCEIKRSAE